MIGHRIVRTVVCLGLLPWAGCHVPAQAPADSPASCSSVSNGDEELGALPLPGETNLEPMGHAGGDPTDPCPSTNAGCGVTGCGTDFFNCTYSNTGAHACGWDGSIQNPPEFSCPKTKTVHVRACPCVPQYPGQLCLNEGRSLVCL